MPAVEASWLRNGAPTTVLRVQYAGRDLVFSDGGEQMRLAVRSTSLVLVARPGLTISAADIERVVAMEPGEDGVRSASVSILPGFDVAMDVESGRDPTGSRAELCQVWPGMDWDDRRVILTGIVDAPVWGGLGEPLEFTLTGSQLIAAKPWPPSTWYVSDSTWPRASADRDVAYVGGNEGRDPNSDGAIYPLVIGYPGAYVQLSQLSGAIITSEVPAVPALFVEGTDSPLWPNDWSILISGGSVEATTATIYNLTQQDKWTATIVRTVDALGQNVSIVHPTVGAEEPVEGDEIYTSWPVSGGGGMLDPYGPGPLRRADHVLRWCLDQSGLPVDHSRMDRMSALAGIGIDTYLNEAVADLWTWAKSNLLPLLPVRAAEGPGGHYAYALDLGVTADRAKWHIEEGRNAERTSRVTSGSIDAVQNRFTIAFAPNLYSGLNCSTYTLTGKRTPEEQNDPTVLLDYACARSQAKYGVRAGAALDVRWLYEPASGIQVLHWLAQLYAVPPLRLSYRLGPDMGSVEAGDSVAITSSRLHWTDKVGHVEVVSPAGAGVEVQVVILGAHAFLGAGT